MLFLVISDIDVNFAYDAADFTNCGKAHRASFYRDGSLVKCCTIAKCLVDFMSNCRGAAFDIFKKIIGCSYNVFYGRACLRFQKGDLLMSTVWFGISFSAIFNFANYLLALMQAFRMTRVSKSIFGGSGGSEVLKILL